MGRGERLWTRAKRQRPEPETVEAERGPGGHGGRGTGAVRGGGGGAPDAVGPRGAGAARLTGRRRPEDDDLDPAVAAVIRGREGDRGPDRRPAEARTGAASGAPKPYVRRPDVSMIVGPQPRDPARGGPSDRRTSATAPEDSPPSPGRWRGNWRTAALSAVLGAVAGIGAFALLEDRGPVSGPRPSAPTTAGRTPVGVIYRSASPAVVSIVADAGRGRASGTGFVLNRAGTIVTNAHVVGDNRVVRVGFGRRARATLGRVVGREPSVDLAVVRVHPRRTRHLRPLLLADSDRARVGDLAVAIGNPFALNRTATAGIVSALGRHVRAPNGVNIDDAIQTDAPINPGNSGGPLLDSRGRVLGVTSLIATTGASRGNVGIGFAVPANTVRDVLPRLMGGGGRP